jgi:hypothetical protein
MNRFSTNQNIYLSQQKPRTLIKCGDCLFYTKNIKQINYLFHFRG